MCSSLYNCKTKQLLVLVCPKNSKQCRKKYPDPCKSINRLHQCKYIQLQAQVLHSESYEQQYAVISNIHMGL